MMTLFDQIPYDQTLGSISDEERQINELTFANFENDVPKTGQYYDKLDLLVIPALILAKKSSDECMKLSSNENMLH